MVLYSLFTSIDKQLGLERVQTRRDIPCKIHDPITAHLVNLSVLLCFIPKSNQIWNFRNESLNKNQIEE